MTEVSGKIYYVYLVTCRAPKPHKENRSLTVHECVEVPPVTSIPFKSVFSQFVQAVKDDEPSYKHSQVKSNHYGESVICARLNVPISLL